MLQRKGDRETVVDAKGECECGDLSGLGSIGSVG